jgi:peptidoglycan DL-endopeptidase CwlO
VIGLPRSFMFCALTAVALAGCGTAAKTKTSSTAPAATTTAASSTPSVTSATSTVAPTPTSAQTTPDTGTTSVAAFKSAFVVEKTRFRTLGSDLEKAVEGAGSKSNAQIEVEFQSLSTRAAQQAVRLAKLDPPAKYRKDLAQLTAAFAAVASDLGTITTAAIRGEPQTARSATIKLVHDAAQVKAHDNRLTAALGLPQTQ